MINAIVAVDIADGIAKYGKIPWHNKEDFKLFKKLTTGNGNNVVVMGRKTFESLPNGELPGRDNIILTRSGFSIDEIEGLDSKYDDVWIIGGESIYRQVFAISLPVLIYVSRMHKVYDCDHTKMKPYCVECYQELHYNITEESSC